MKESSQKKGFQLNESICTLVILKKHSYPNVFFMQVKINASLKNFFKKKKKKNGLEQ